MSLVFVAVVVSPVHAAEAKSEKPPIKWTKGPAKVDIGTSLGELNLGTDLVFAGQQDTVRVLRDMGNPSDGSEMGLVTSAIEGENWFVVFEWRDVGYVKDNDRDKINASALLESIQRASEVANEERKKQGVSALHVVGWAEPPHYDQQSHNLTWAIKGKSDDGTEVVNYNVRLLGRQGVMSLTLVDDPAGLATAKPRIDAVIQSYRFKPGRTYAEWVPGDRVAKYGLTALVAAGAGAAAAKTGLLAALGAMLAKAWKFVVVVVAGAAASVAQAFKKIFRRIERPNPPIRGGEGQ